MQDFGSPPIVIWNTFAGMVLIDLTIIGLTVTMFVVAIRRGLLRADAMPRTGRVLIMMAVTLTACFYLADLVSIAVLPRALSVAAASTAIDFLHTQLRVPVTLLSLLLTVSGIIAVAYHRTNLLARQRHVEARMRAAEKSVIQSETRFRSLVEQSPDAIYCFEFDPPIPVDLPLTEQIALSHAAVLTECNRVFAREIAKSDLSEALGTRFGDLDSAKDRSSHDEFFSQFVRGGYRLVDYEQVYTTPDGEERALKINLAGVVSDGRLHRMWGSERNILDIRQTRAALAERLRFQEFVSDISTRLISAPDDKAIENLGACLRDSCRYVRSDRTSLLWLNRETDTVDVVCFWSEHDEPPWSKLSSEYFPWMVPRLLAGKLVRVSLLDDLPPEAQKDRESLARIGLKSIAVVPIVVGGAVLGACTFSNIGDDRNWTDRDMADLKVLTELFGSSVIRIRSHEALKAALGELRTATERLEAENVYLRDEIRSTHGFNELIGESETLLRCLRLVEQVSKTDTTVLIQGETGTGKELVARALHEHSTRNRRPLVKVNCAALPANLIESELFGYEKGAFTGATSKKKGRFDLANGGTIFLDEIADFPLELQGKLLRVLQEGEFQRLGGSETIRVDVRVIAATNRNLIEAVDSGEFRADLYYRINTFPLNLPPLRERQGDIRILAEHFTRIHAQQLGKSVSAISSAMLAQMESYSWPGNVRQLESVIQRALISAQGDTLELAEALDSSPVNAARSAGVVLDLHGMERKYIEEVLGRCDWMISGPHGAAAILGVPASTLRSKMKKLGIARPRAIRNL